LKTSSVAAHILIIEDNDMSFVLADYLLRQTGYSTGRAADGNDGIRAALENTADLILCDLDLPGMDGREVLNALRANGAWRAVPVLAFTGDSTWTDQGVLLASGFAGCVLKPPDPRTFAATVGQHLAPQLRAV
jgi:CheY-like chemotaxis protein